LIGRRSVSVVSKRKAEQIIAPLPASYLKLSLRSFTRAAVDFEGPFFNKTRGGKPI